MTNWSSDSNETLYNSSYHSKCTARGTNTLICLAILIIHFLHFFQTGLWTDTINLNNSKKLLYFGDQSQSAPASTTPDSLDYHLDHSQMTQAGISKGHELGNGWKMFIEDKLNKITPKQQLLFVCCLVVWFFQFVPSLIMWSIVHKVHCLLFLP